MLYFSAPWCGPCKMFKPIVEQFQQKQSGCNVVYVDIEANEELATQFNVKAVPTCVFLKNEKEVSRFSGLKGLAYLENLLDEATI